MKARYVCTAVVGSSLLIGGHLAAQTTVTLYGTVEGVAYSRQLAGESRVSRVDNGLLSPSRWGLRGTEDLGGGLSAVFDLSSHLRLDTGEYGRTGADPFWSRMAYVGLQGSFGQVILGRMPTPTFINAIRNNAFGEGTGLSPFLLQAFVGGQPSLAFRSGSDNIWGNSVAYTTPSWLGSTASVQWAPSEGGIEGRRLDGSVSYRDGPLAATMSYSRIAGGAYSTPRRPTDPAGAPYVLQGEKGLVGGLSYDFKVVQAYAQFASAKLRPTGLPEISLNTGSLSAAIPVGQARVLAGWARTARVQAGVTDRTRSTATMAYDYFLSKRTDVYVAAIRDSATGLASGTGVAVGLRHSF